METKATFFNVVAKALSVPAEQVTETLQYQEIPEWDSMSHLALVSELERHYNISIEMTDVLEMGSIREIITLLGKYQVILN